MLDSDCAIGTFPGPKKENPGSNPYPPSHTSLLGTKAHPHSTWRPLSSDEDDKGQHMTNSAMTVYV